MKVMVIGGGGREHAITRKILESPKVEKVVCAPGNASMADEAECVDIQASDLNGLLSYALSEGMDLTFVGPEAPLVEGIVDLFGANGLKAFGPSAAAARLEGSKTFAKEIMEKYGVPTGMANSFEDADDAHAFLSQLEPPYVVKADGLAAGKGVFICKDLADAEKALRECFEARRFGASGETVLVEEFLAGQEVSLLAFCDGETVLPMTAAQDYKRIFDGDEGPNTGGMGSYSPVPLLDEAMRQRIIDEIMVPTVRGMAAEGIPYKGILYGGIILTVQGPKTLEFNCRFGDPETQAIIPRMESDLVELMLACVDGGLAGMQCEWSQEKCVTVVLASAGYPATSSSGDVITGTAEADAMPGVQVYGAGTARADGQLMTAGGRVLNVSALGADFAEARSRAYEAVSKISFDGMQCRKDIALRAVEQEKDA